jgi:hypothetical protein
VPSGETGSLVFGSETYLFAARLFGLLEEKVSNAFSFLLSLTIVENFCLISCRASLLG